MEVDDVAVLGKGHHKLRNGRTDVADHYAADNKDAHPLHPPGDRQHKGHGGHGPRKGGCDQGKGAGEQALVQKKPP